MRRQSEKTTVEAEAPGKGRKRKIEFGESQADHKRLRPENSASSAASGNSTCDSDHVLASCCSSNEWCDVTDNRSKRVDLEETEVVLEFSASSSGGSFVCSNRRETTPSSKVVRIQLGEVASTARAAAGEDEKLVSESEIEDFFIAAEMELHKQFIHKYNYDIVKDHPVEGRYEWIKFT